MTDRNVRVTPTAKNAKEMDVKKKINRAQLNDMAREALNIPRDVSIKFVMDQRDVMRALLCPESEIDALFPLPKIAANKETKVSTKSYVSIDEQNCFSTDSALYSVKKIIKGMLESMIYAVDKFADVGPRSVYFSENIEKMPNLESAVTSLEHKRLYPTPMQQKKRLRLVGADAKKKAARTPIEERMYLLSDWTNQVCAIKNRVFVKGMAPYLKDAIIYQPCMRTLDNAHLRIAEYKIESPFTPHLYYDEMIHMLTRLCDTTFDSVHFDDVERLDPEETIGSLVELTKKLIESVDFLDKYMSAFPVEKRPWLNIVNPQHSNRVWEL